jgi:hypothetical protein
MLLLEGYVSNFTRAKYYYFCVEFSDFYVNQTLAGQTISLLICFLVDHSAQIYRAKNETFRKIFIIIQLLNEIMKNNLFVNVVKF